MKISLISLLLFFNSFIAHSQIGGTKIPGPITINDSIRVSEGAKLKLGKGSDPRTGDFVFLYFPPNGWLGLPEQYMPHSYSGMEMTVKFFKEWSTNKTGTKTITVIDAPGRNAIAEIDNAIRAGEIVAINGISVVPKVEPPTVIIQQKSSVADEIKKLKELLDDSLITKEEFETQKKKLLDGN